jgi:hypothetical protein
MRYLIVILLFISCSKESQECSESRKQLINDKMVYNQNKDTSLNNILYNNIQESNIRVYNTCQSGTLINN